MCFCLREYGTWLVLSDRECCLIVHLTWYTGTGVNISPHPDIMIPGHFRKENHVSD